MQQQAYSEDAEMINSIEKSSPECRGLCRGKKKNKSHNQSFVLILLYVHILMVVLPMISVALLNSKKCNIYDRLDSRGLRSHHSKGCCKYTGFTATQRGTSACLMQKRFEKSPEADNRAARHAQRSDTARWAHSNEGLAQAVIMNTLYSRQWRPRRKVLEL